MFKKRTLFIVSILVISLIPAYFMAQDKADQAEQKIMKIDPDKCNNCYKCFTYCPVNAIKVDEETGSPVIVQDSCVKCGLCRKNCPMSAIYLRKTGSKTIITDTVIENGDTLIEKREDVKTTQHYTGKRYIDHPEAKKYYESVKDLKPTVDQDKCRSCGLCVRICPENAIKLKDDKLIINTKECIGCGACIRGCPFSAVEWQE